MTISFQRCLNHPAREAAALCLGCGQNFCRECVTEHDGRVICASCLRREAETATVRHRRFAGLARVTGAIAGVMTAWLFFYLAGQAMLALPESFHEGTLWREPNEEE